MQVINEYTKEEKANIGHLNLLSIFYFVFGGLSLLGAFIVLIYSVILGAISTKIGYIDDVSNADGLFELIFGTVTVILIIAFVLLLTVGILQIISGFKLRKLTHRNLSLIVGILALPSFPLGTALGVFTLIVLSRPEVKELYRKTQESIRQDIYGIK